MRVLAPPAKHAGPTAPATAQCACGARATGVGPCGACRRGGRNRRGSAAAGHGAALALATASPRSLRIGPADDPQERAAEAVAGGHERRPAPTPDPSRAPAIVHDALRSPGRPLEAATRAALEPRVGADLSAVRVHTGARAAASAAAVAADAYTVGRDVVFGAGAYAPATSAGRRLIAHEVAHVAQNAAGGGATVLRRRVRAQTPAAATEVVRQLSTLCPAAGLSSSGQDITAGEESCRSSSNLSCECVCDTITDATRVYSISLLSAVASTKSETMHDGSTQTIPDSSLWPSTDSRDSANPEIETLDARGSGIEFGFFRSTGNGSWYDPWRILTHELCGHARLGQGYAGTTGNRPGHDATIDTENQIASEHGQAARGHFSDRRQGEACYNPVGDRSRVAFRQVDGWHYEAP